MSRSPSILDVAREADVAPSTVSLVMNHHDRVKPETRRRVRNVIEKMGYQGRRRGPKPKSNRALQIALVYTQDSFDDGKLSTYCHDLMSGAKRAIGNGPSSLSILRGLEHVDQDDMFRLQIESGDFDGVLLFGPMPEDGYLEYLQQRGIPLVAFNRPSVDDRHSCVTLDFRGGARLAIEHLIDHGHTKIATIEGTTKRGWLQDQVHRGLADAFSQAKLEPVLSLQYEGGNGPTDIQAICDQIRQSDATALYTGDRLAVRCIEYLHQQGVDVPHDMSVIGFDGMKLTTTNNLRLTSIGFDKDDMGRKAVSLIERLNAAKPDICWAIETVPTYLEEGDTVTMRPEN